MIQADVTRITSRERVSPLATIRSTIFCPFSFNYKFEELPLFQHRVAGETFFSALIDGEAEIEYDHNGDWYITDLWIRGDNHKVGDDARDRMINLDADRDQALYMMALDALEGRHSTRIEEIIAEELLEA